MLCVKPHNTCFHLELYVNISMFHSRIVVFARVCVCICSAPANICIHHGVCMYKMCIVIRQRAVVFIRVQHVHLCMHTYPQAYMFLFIQNPDIFLLQWHCSDTCMSLLPVVLEYSGKGKP